MNRLFGIVLGVSLLGLGMPAATRAQNAAAEKELRAAWAKGFALDEQGKYQESLPYYQKALELAQSVYGNDHVTTAKIQNNLATLYKDMGQYAKAEPLYQRSLAIREAKLGKDHPDVADSLNNLATLYWDMGQYAKAEPLHQRSLAIREAKLGKDHPDVADSLSNLANLYKDMGQYAKAEPLYQRSLAIREAKLGKDHPRVAQNLNNLAILYSDMGQYAKAEPLHQRSLAIREAKLGKDHPDVAASLNNLAILYSDMGQYAKAEPLYQRSLAIREAKLGKNHPDVAGSLNNLALLYSHMGQYAKAEPLYQRSLEIKEAKLGKDHPDFAGSLNNLALLYKNIGQYAKAEPLYQRSLAISEAKLGKDHPRVAQNLNNLASLYKDMGQYAKAELLYQRSLAIGEAKLGKDHPDVASSLNNLAVLYTVMGQYAKAEPLYQRSLAIREAKLGKDHAGVAGSLNNLANLYADMGQYAKAEPLHQRSLEIKEAKLGKDHPDVALSLNGLALVQAATQNWDASLRTTQQLRRLDSRFARSLLLHLNAAEQRQYLDTTEYRAFNALSLGLLRREDSATVSASAGWLINLKGLAQEALAQRALLERDTADPARRDLVARLRAVRQEQAALALTAPKPGQEETRRQRLQELAAQQRELEGKLARAGGLPPPVEWVELAGVRAALPANAVLIDIARFKVTNFNGKGNEKSYHPARYAAWLVPAQDKGDIRIVDLGEAEPIDAAVRNVRKALSAARQVIRQQGEPDAEKELTKALEDLATLVLRPLEKEIASFERWVISPDGNLWLVPWAAIPLADGKYAIEAHPIRYLVSARDLVTSPSSVKPGRPRIVADPDFDLGLEVARAEVKRLVGFTNSSTELRGVSNSMNVPAVSRLPGTLAEAKAIQPLIDRYTKEETWLYQGSKAVEGVVKQFKNPRVLVLSTHGFFLEDQETKSDDRVVVAGEAKGPALTKDGKLLENPLLRCGLLLAGCNNRSKAAADDEDGVLTGMEIVGMDLRGTELVVLSACETGLGEVRNGEGVAGLRQAFQLAGAQSVLATLWQIPDRETAQLMSQFFDELAKGKSKADALRGAQLKLIAERREKRAAAHPFFWAAFTVTGGIEPVSGKK